MKKEKEVEVESTGPDYHDIRKNKKKSKNQKKDWNSYSQLTDLVKIFKKTNKEEDLLTVLKALEGIVNTYTIIIAPGNADQNIGFLNPYMKKFLGLFLSKAEQANCTYQTYMQAVYRVRWIMRHYSYEDVYNMVIAELVKVIRNMRVIEGCDCIYYIQFIVKFQLHSMVLKHANDAIVAIHDMPDNFKEEENESNDEVDKLQYYYTDVSSDFEDKLISSLYDNIDISAITRTDDIYSVLTYYEKYILYLIDYLGLTMKQILNILKHETYEDLLEKIDDIKYKLEILRDEYK